MPTRGESLAPAAPRATSQKLLPLLRRRLRQLTRIAAVMAICLVPAVSALAIWWLTSLDGLPDIGDPFDVAAFRAVRVPDDRNAFSFLRRAEVTLTPSPSHLALTWSQADAGTREWVEAHRRAIALFRRGADQPDASSPGGDSLANGQRAALLVLLEASRRQEAGDMAGAWDCYRAILRMANHIRRRGSLDQRRDLYAYWDGLSRRRLATWAADPRTTIPQLHGALEEVLEGEPKPEWDVSAMKAAYLAMERSLERPVLPFVEEEVGWGYHGRLGDMQLSSEMAGSLDAGCRLLLREPERSRRVLRLLYANWLAHADPRGPRPRTPAVRASFFLRTSTAPMSKGTTTVSLYPVGPRAPTGARSLSPLGVASWLVSTHDLKLRILVANRSGWPWSPDRLRDRRAHGDLVLLLAGEIYRRERGVLPPSEESLVGTYLERLPDDGLAETGDEGTPAIAAPGAEAPSPPK
jgi:hypothetical protein